MMMDDAYFRQENDIPAVCTESLAQIGFFGINEILFIEQPDFFQRCLPDHHETSRQRVHFHNSIMRKELHVFA